MNENTQLTENPAEEPAQASTEQKIAGDHNLAVSLDHIEGSRVEIPQPPVVEKAMVENSMAISVSADQDAGIENSLVMAAAAGRDMSSTNGLEIVVAVGHDLKIQQGVAGVLRVGGEAQVENGTIGLLVAKSGVTLNNSRVLMTTPQAIALGAAFGIVYALLRTRLGGKKKAA
jgi:hypothetical protein